MKYLMGCVLALALLIPQPAKAGRDEALIGGAIALGIVGIIAAQAERNRHRHRYHNHYYVPPRRHHHDHYRPVHRNQFHHNHLHRR